MKTVNLVERFLVMLVLMTMLSITYSFADDELVDILLLNSYHDGYQWSNDTKQGVKDVFDKYTDDYHMRIEHMDTKNISTDAYMLELVELYKFKYDADEFDLIICADDNALKFLLKYRDYLFGNTPVFFCGVNTLSTHDFTGADYFYGVVEKHSIAQTVEMALTLNPELKNVYLVVDDSITGRATKRDAKADMEYMKECINFNIYEDKSFNEIMEAVKTLNPNENMVIQSFYVVDKDGSTYPLEYTAEKLVKNSSAPVFGIFSFGFGQGSVGGKFVEGYTQGDRVAKMVVGYLKDGVVEGERFIVDESFNRYYFDYEMMQRFGFDMERIPSNSIVINEPISFYKKHQSVINVSLGILVMLMIYVYILRRQIRFQTSRIIAAQTQLIEAEKMASLGRLVAGVAHEVNTPIGIGVSLASYIAKETEIIVEKVKEKKLSGNTLKDYLEKIYSSSELMGSTMERASELINSFKQVAVDQTVDEKRVIELGQYITDIIISLKSELRTKNVEVIVECEEALNIYCYTGAIYQIILNLIMNSLNHGFEGDQLGIIRITLTRGRYDCSKTKTDCVKINYHDNGVGIPTNELKKIYDPFFTTKRNDGGSGLGLNIVYNLVTQRLMGRIQCKSVVDEYTEFDIMFPTE